MIWTFLFWLSIAFLAYTTIARLIWPAFSKKEGKDSGGKAIWFAAGVAVLLLALSIYMKAEPVLRSTDWSDAQLTELENLRGAIDYYEQARNIKQGHTPSSDDWQSVVALLQASQNQALTVSEDVMKKVHPLLPTHFRNEFLPGLSAGIYGLIKYNDRVVKPNTNVDTLNLDYPDSITVGTELLSRWNKWYDDQKAVIGTKLGS